MEIFNILYMRLARLKTSVILLSTYMGKKSLVIHSVSAIEKISVRGVNT